MSEPHEELLEIADKLDSAIARLRVPSFEGPLEKLKVAAEEVGRSWCGSWLGYHSRVYYAGLRPIPAGANFSIEWGIEEKLGGYGSVGNWEEFKSDYVIRQIQGKAESPRLDLITESSEQLRKLIETEKGEVQSILAAVRDPDEFLTEIRKEISKISVHSRREILDSWRPRNQIVTRDNLAAGQGLKTPPHISVLADIASIREPILAGTNLSTDTRRAASHLMRLARQKKQSKIVGTNVFIGHGSSPAWKDLRDFIRDRVKLPWDEFNRVPVAGIPNSIRLNEMLESAAVALLVMTAEDELAGGKYVARQIVVHEAGLFQGRLGFTKAIILLEDGCEEFSNIHGIGQIRFPRGNVAASFEEIRRVLEREGLIPSP